MGGGIVLGGDIVSGLDRYLRDVVCVRMREEEDG